MIFGSPSSFRCESRSENTAEAVRHLCRWCKVSLDYRTTNHPWAGGALRGWGVGYTKCWRGSTSNVLAPGTKPWSQRPGPTGWSRKKVLPATHHHSRCFFVDTHVLRWTIWRLRLTSLPLVKDWSGRWRRESKKLAKTSHPRIAASEKTRRREHHDSGMA